MKGPVEYQTKIHIFRVLIVLCIKASLPHKVFYIDVKRAGVFFQVEELTAIYTYLPVEKSNADPDFKGYLKVRVDFALDLEDGC